MTKTPSRWPYPALLGDLGGTHLRLGTVAAPAAAPACIETLRTGDYDDLGDAIGDYLEQTGQRGETAPRSLAIALAAPAETARQKPIRLTNDRGFVVDGRAIAARHGFAARWIVNDFEALAWSAATFGDGDLEVIGERAPSRDATMAVIGPGTGLGCATLVRAGRGWQAVAGEGGHVTLAARTAFEREVVAAALDGDEHLSAEALLSGLGLPRLHAAVARALGQARPAAGADAPAITGQALEDDAAGRSGTLAQRTVDVFCSLLGGFAGNVALTVGARGGVLLAGGVANRLAGPLGRGGFRARFEDKGRFADYLGAIGTARILREQPALDGLAWAIRNVADKLPVQRR